jgi:hypothetical protein
MALLTIEPSELTAGDTWSWLKSLADYPANQGWTLKYSFTNATNKFSFAATASGSDHQITVPAATTAGYPSGRYQWQAYASKAGERYQVTSGTLVVLANLDALDSYDGRSHAVKTLEAIEAVIENRASMDQQKYMIAGRSLERIPVTDLLALRSTYRVEVASEKNAERLRKGLPNKNKLLVRFNI